MIIGDMMNIQYNNKKTFFFNLYRTTQTKTTDEPECRSDVFEFVGLMCKSP